MSKTFSHRTLLGIGLWIIILPSLGFPQSWKNFFFVMTGLFIVWDAYILYRIKQNARGKASTRSTKTFSETMTPVTAMDAGNDKEEN